MIFLRKRRQGRGGSVPAPQRDLFEEELPSVLRQNHAPPTAEQLGEILRQSREQQGLGIDEMAKRTRIRDIYLLALEEGKMEKLPGATFVAGFLRIYAENLALRDTDLVERYLATAGSGDTSLQVDTYPTPATARHRPSVVVVLGGILGLLGLFVFYESYYLGESVPFPPPELPATPPLRTDVGREGGGGLVDPARQSEVVVTDGSGDAQPNADAEPGSAGFFAWVAQWLPGGRQPDGTVSSSPEADLKEQEGAPPLTEEKPSQPAAAGTSKGAAAPASLAAVPESPRSAVVPVSPKLAMVAGGNKAEGNKAEGNKAEGNKAEGNKLDVVPASSKAPPPAPQVAAAEPPSKTPTLKPASKVVESKDPAVAIKQRYPEKGSNADFVPETPQAVSMLASELVWVQITDKDGQMLKDMVMQPDQLFRVPVGGRFFATFGNAGAVRVRVGSRALPLLGRPGEELDAVDLDPDALLQRVKK